MERHDPYMVQFSWWVTAALYVKESRPYIFRVWLVSTHFEPIIAEITLGDNDFAIICHGRLAN